MLSNIITKIKQVFTPVSQHDTLDAFVTRQQPTSIGDVEYWINVYDRNQYQYRSANFSHHYR